MLQERAEQLALKRQQAEQQLREKEAENELIRIAYERNNCLQEESDRLEKLAVQQYRDDLRKQIEYNNQLRVSKRLLLQLDSNQVFKYVTPYDHNLQRWWIDQFLSRNKVEQREEHMVWKKSENKVSSVLQEFF